MKDLSRTAPPTTMRAMVLEQFGADLALRDVARPVPGAGQVLVKVAASAVNPLDIKIKLGEAAHAQVMTPAVLGIDLAGTVVDLGPGVDRFDIGDEVYGMAGGVGNNPGSLAEYAAVDADLIAVKPARLSMTEAAALPLAMITAWEGLIDRADVQPGQTVLVHGGAGGVGHIAVQLARARGAVVYATGRSSADLDLIRGYGAQAIDAHTPAQEYVASITGGAGFDVIFDTIGGATLDASFGAVRRYTGHVVSILGWGAHSLAPLSFRGATYSGVFTLLPLLTGQGRAHHGDVLTAAAEIVDTGALTPRVDETPYGWTTVYRAHQAVESGTADGKVVVDLTHD
jgi:NADPH:quinone reductase-like Zn-dependent oxidoreductase